MKKLSPLLLLALLPILPWGCANQPNDEIMSGASQVELRSFQTRAFDTTDKILMMRSVIATLQDLGFILDEANEVIGVVTGTKTSGSQIRMTVVVRPRGETQLMVRASAYFDVKPIESPEPYQDFFTSLEKSVFLTAHQVD